MAHDAYASVRCYSLWGCSVAMIIALEISALVGSSYVTECAARRRRLRCARGTSLIGIASRCGQENLSLPLPHQHAAMRAEASGRLCVCCGTKHHKHGTKFEPCPHDHERSTTAHNDV